MQFLPSVPINNRIEWIQLIKDLATERGIQNPLAFSRGIEKEAYDRRQKIKHVSGDVIVYQYGDKEVLDLDSEIKHSSAALHYYMKNLRRVAWALQKSKYFSEELLDWINTTDDIFLQNTEQEKWEETFFSQQNLARKILSGKTPNTAQIGIFSCPSCKSFDVDTEQKQTRSADEPMTVFCTCNGCGKRFVR